MGRKKHNQELSEEELLLQSLGGSPKPQEKPTEQKAPESPEEPPTLSLREQLEASMGSLGPRRSKRGKTTSKDTKRGRVDIIRQTAHRGGKGVTLVKNFTGISLEEKQALAKKIQKACGVGGTVKNGCIEIQGENRDEVKRILLEAGFTPVFAGG